MDQKPTTIAIIIFSIILLVSLAVWGWSTLPQHEARAARTAALIPYLEAQAQIDTAQQASDAQLRSERQLMIQPLKIAAQTTAYIMLIIGIIAASVYGLHATRHHGRRVARQMALPVIHKTDNYLILGDGQRTYIIDQLTGQINAAFTEIPGNANRAQIMERLLLTQALADAAAAVAKQTKDPAVSDYLLAQMENITHANTTPTHDPAAHSSVYAQRPARAAAVQNHQTANQRPGTAAGDD